MRVGDGSAAAGSWARATLMEFSGAVTASAAKLAGSTSSWVGGVVGDGVSTGDAPEGGRGGWGTMRRTPSRPSSGGSRREAGDGATTERRTRAGSEPALDAGGVGAGVVAAGAGASELATEGAALFAGAVVSGVRWTGASTAGVELRRLRGRRCMSAGPSFGSDADSETDSARARAAAVEPDGADASGAGSVGAAGLAGVTSPEGSRDSERLSSSIPAPDISWTMERLRTVPSPRGGTAGELRPRAASIAAAEGPETLGAVSRCRCSVAAMRCAMRLNHVSLPKAIGPAGDGSELASVPSGAASPGVDAGALSNWRETGGGTGLAATPR